MGRQRSSDTAPPDSPGPGECHPSPDPWNLCPAEGEREEGREGGREGGREKGGREGGEGEDVNGKRQTKYIMYMYMYIVIYIYIYIYMYM